MIDSNCKSRPRGVCVWNTSQGLTVIGITWPCHTLAALSLPPIETRDAGGRLGLCPLLGHTQTNWCLIPGGRVVAVLGARGSRAINGALPPLTQDLADENNRSVVIAWPGEAERREGAGG
ncbi:hypothetical protein KIL84_008888 [Mauremys mutica]|uniref:Uncharacterized protein n=1 Tax=Mauremys mutica TaxID=74926 RepID=A0A9D4ASU0_9SAUR|nr:hypothetical protein KIL84_008888 [Mauremys mutica]